MSEAWKPNDLERAALLNARRAIGYVVANIHSSSSIARYILPGCQERATESLSDTLQSIDDLRLLLGQSVLELEHARRMVMHAAGVR